MFRIADNVHLVFDHPHRHGLSGKDVERHRRDQSSEPCNRHTNSTLTAASPCPSAAEWSCIIRCRDCKRQLVNLFSWASQLLVGLQPLENKNFVTAGGFDGALMDKAFREMAEGKPVEEPGYGGNHEEADTRVWQHAVKFPKALVYSPDTDVMIIGLGVVDQGTHAIVRNDMPGSQQQTFIDISSLQDKIHRDPALSSIPKRRGARPFRMSLLPAAAILHHSCQV